MLVPRLQLIGYGKQILTEAAWATEILAEIETILDAHRERLIAVQERKKHLAGDLVWRKSGWGVARTEASITKGEKMKVYWRSSGQEATVMAAGYIVNFRLASQDFDDLKDLMAMLLESRETAPAL